MKEKIVYIISDTEKSLEFEWTASHFAQTVNIHFILIGKESTALSRHLTSINVPFTIIQNQTYPSLLGKVFSLIKKLKPTIVHCHLWRATLIGLLASYLAGVRKRVFTRHHSMIHYYEFKKGRKWDRVNNRLATDIIVISDNVKQVIIDLDKGDKKKIHVIHHGFNLDYFNPVNTERLSRIKNLYKVESKNPVVGVISRYLELKGIQYIIPAFKKLLEKKPSSHLMLANARGEFQKAIQTLLKELPPNTYTEISFEEDLASLYQTFDIFVHVPVDPQREAFGQTYVEALASGIPSIFTLSGVAPEFIKHEENALVVPFCDSESIYKAMVRILNDSELRNHLIANGKESANQFPLSKMIDQLRQVYES